MKEIIQGLITFIAAGYLLYRSLAKHQLLLFILAAFLLSLQLKRWPLHIPFAISHGVLAGVVAVCCFYDFFKKKDRHFLLYGLVFLYFAFMSIIEVASRLR